MKKIFAIFLVVALMSSCVSNAKYNTSRGLNFSPSVQGPTGRVFGRILKSLEKAHTLRGTVDVTMRTTDYFYKKTIIDSTSFYTGRGYYRGFATQDFKVGPYLGPYNQRQPSLTFTNHLDAINFKMELSKYNVVNKRNVGSYDYTNTQLQTRPASAVMNLVDSLELQRKIGELKKSVEDTMKSFNCTLK